MSDGAGEGATRLGVYRGGMYREGGTYPPCYRGGIYRGVVYPPWYQGGIQGGYPTYKRAYREAYREEREPSAQRPPGFLRKRRNPSAQKPPGLLRKERRTSAQRSPGLPKNVKGRARTSASLFHPFHCWLEKRSLVPPCFL